MYIRIKFVSDKTNFELSISDTRKFTQKWCSIKKKILEEKMTFIFNIINYSSIDENDDFQNSKWNDECY